MDGMILSALLFLSSPQGQPQFTKAVVRRLSPRDFRLLPAAVVESLEARKCLIPQYHHDKTPHNVIRGSFTGAKQKEWAVLCSRRGSSSILIFQADTVKLVAKIADAEDDNYLQADVDGKLYFSRVISAVGKDYILEHYKAYGGPEPPPIRRHGIDDAFAEKGSVVRYFHRRKWLELQGSD